MEYKFRITGKQYKRLHEHLFPGDGKEAVAFARCGILKTADTFVLCVREVLFLPYEICARSEDTVTWPTEFILPIVNSISITKEVLVKFHSHPNGIRTFSEIDDRSDVEMSEIIENRVGRAPCFASILVCCDGICAGRIFMGIRESEAIQTFIIAGDNIAIYAKEVDNIRSDIDLRTVQVFGDGTINKCRQLKIAIVGCSGTGSIVVEQLARLGIGHLILVDPDIVEDKNLPRILNSYQLHSDQNTPKVNVLEDAINKMGLGTKVEAFNKSIVDTQMVQKVAEADIIFGCTDSVESRNILNLISAHYCMPYFDLGIRIDSDGVGGVSQIAGSVNYIQPDGSSLLSRGVFSTTDLFDEALKRTQPAEYEAQKKDGYVRGVKVDRPAVISVNMLAASIAVNEFLARIHNYRDDPNSESAIQRFSLTQNRFFSEPDGQPCETYSKVVGRGDRTPLLGLPCLQIEPK